MNDILGTKVERKGGKLLSANLISLTTPGGDIALGAGASGQYGRSIIPTEVFGSTVVYYTSGPSQGNIGIDTVVGEDGFFSMIDDETGICNLESLNVLGGSECGTGQSGFNIDDAILESVGFGWQAGATPVQNSARFLFGSMTR